MTRTNRHELLVGTKNEGKIAEFWSLLARLQLRLRKLAEFPEIPDVEETGRTFLDNAILKATAYARQSGLWTLADDSGLEVDALGGAPGVFSARYGGPEANQTQRNERLLEELSRSADADRRARFICIIAIADPHARIAHVSTGICEGRISQAPRGTGGFGYDPLFLPDGFDQTFGELSPEIKMSISHRAKAIEEAHSFLNGRF